jgi:hypothetical protein
MVKLGAISIMTDYVIPCDAFARLSNILRVIPAECDDHFRSIRIDNGVIVSCNRTVMAVENIGAVAGIIHIIAHPGLIEQCRKEAPFASTLTITVNDALKFAVAKTTLGYVHPGNCCLWSDAATDFDRWRSIAMATKEPAKVNRGGMFWDTEHITNLAASSPSGRLVFEETIDAQGRPTVVRDINDYNWFGIFNPYSLADNYNPATLPTWMTA